jgi:hypothetical protein
MPRWRKVRLSRGDVGEGAAEAAWWSVPDVGGLDGLALALLIPVGALVVAVVLIPLLLFGIELIVVGFVLAAGMVDSSGVGGSCRPGVTTTRVRL